jgi:hypothetical protein
MLNKHKTSFALTSRKTSVIQNVIQISIKLQDVPIKAKQQRITESSLSPGSTRR